MAHSVGPSEDQQSYSHGRSIHMYHSQSVQAFSRYQWDILCAFSMWQTNVWYNDSASYVLLLQCFKRDNRIVCSLLIDQAVTDNTTGSNEQLHTHIYHITNGNIMNCLCKCTMRPQL